MKAKAGFGKPNKLNRLQSLQKRLNALREKHKLQNSDPRYKNSLDSRDWSRIVPDGWTSHQATQASNARDLLVQFKVSSQCRQVWLRCYQPRPVEGEICMCGHPVPDHSGGGLCAAGLGICCCRKPAPAILVSDTRHFYKASKGPHESHALVMGIETLRNAGGKFLRIVPWICKAPNCGRKKGTNPVRMRTRYNLAMGLSVQELHQLMCEPCLFQSLNGGYLDD